LSIRTRILGETKSPRSGTFEMVEVGVLVQRNDWGIDLSD